MKVRKLEVTETPAEILLQGRCFVLAFERRRGKGTQLRLQNGQGWHSLLPADGWIGDNLELPVEYCRVQQIAEDCARLQVLRQNAEFRVLDEYEVYGSGWIICSSQWEVLAEKAKFLPLQVGVVLSEDAVFKHACRCKFLDNNQDERESIRGMAIDFSVDDRPVSNSLNFLLEKTTSDIDGRACRKVLESGADCRFWGWKLSSGWRYPHSRGFCYRNRWALCVSGLDFAPNPVRGQRIYHYFGFALPFPDDRLIAEMAEYGASMLILHNSWNYISGLSPVSESELQRVAGQCRRHRIRLLPYCTPYLIAHRDPAFRRLKSFRTSCLDVWMAAKDNQMTSYTLLENWDCDELCLRCPEAFDFMFSSAMDCVRKYQLDGLYVDFAWPAQGLCCDEKHPHEKGLFNFYDYFRLLRSWRQALGPEKIMIGHGGGFLIASDMLEGFDACLTGEAQARMNPETLGCQFGCASALWTIQRSKGELFRSSRTVEESIREGMTIHYGVGIGGKAVIASLDPAHHREMIALWQMYRAFPVEKAWYYNHLSPLPGVLLDNPEVYYSLYVTAAGQALLLLVNAGGELSSAFPSVGVTAVLQLNTVGLGKKLQCVPLRGSDYQTFRTGAAFPVEEGVLRVPEIALHEFVGFVLFEEGNPPQELLELEKHLQSRFARLPDLLGAKQERLQQQDLLLQQFSRDPRAGENVSFQEFTRGRSAE